MTSYTLCCFSCNTPFSVLLPEDSTRAGYSKCEDKNTTYHNLERAVECQNCDHRNRVYYCSETHPLIATED